MFDTAIFYDIENLIKGYHISSDELKEVSLREISGSIRNALKEVRPDGQIAIQRAYADWSNRRLNLLRNEVNQLGIDPIQVFAFNYDRTKNAADIQLAIDAIDLVHTKPGIQVFVIVSGDGGFATLAKKLHEHGRAVIGGAYSRATNRVFREVCDKFVALRDPEAEDEPPRMTAKTPPKPQGVMLPPPPKPLDAHFLDRMKLRLKPIGCRDVKAICDQANITFKWLLQDPESKLMLTEKGMALSVAKTVLCHAIKDFNELRLGYAKFSEALQCLCKGTSLCVRLNLGGLTLAERKPGTESLPDLDPRPAHSVEAYHSILGAGRLRVPPIGDLEAVVQFVAEHQATGQPLDHLIEDAAEAVGNTHDFESVKLAVMLCVQAGIFRRDTASNGDTACTKLTQFKSRDLILRRIFDECEKKLSTELNEISETTDVNILRLLVPVYSSMSASGT